MNENQSRGLLGFEKASTPKATKSPSLRDLEWAAGFLEGEAWFGKYGAYRGGEHLTATQAFEEPLLKLQCLFGGHVNTQKVRGSNRKPTWIWSVSGSRARGIMMTLYPLLSSRRQEAIRKALYDPPNQDVASINRNTAKSRTSA